MPQETTTEVNKSENVLPEWVSASRPFKTRTREFYKTTTALVFLVVVILAFIGEFLLIGVILATYFVAYVLSTVPPETIKHKVTTLGIETADHFHKWEEMHEFWFDERHGQKMMVVRLLFGFPSHLQLLLGEVSEEKLKKIISDKIPYREKPERTFLDRTSAWLSDKLPLERLS
jgi:hypothetical protein